MFFASSFKFPVRLKTIDRDCLGKATTADGLLYDLKFMFLAF
jgi:hypothetical protein